MNLRLILVISMLISLNVILFMGGLGTVILFGATFLYSVSMAWGIAYIYKELTK